MLTKQELLNITGGSISGWTIAGVIAAVVTFIGAIADGFVNPRQCND